MGWRKYIAKGWRKYFATTSIPQVVAMASIQVNDNDVLVGTTSSPQLVAMDSVQVNDNDVLVGVEKEANIMREYLLSGENALEAISVVGMGGIGKTTLALTVYNSTPSVDRHFDVKVWCTVSQSYQLRDLLLKILAQMNIDNSNGDDEDLAVRLYSNLKKRRYLVVLDDIWDTNVWTNLKRYLPNDYNGSRILITTRIRSVALEFNKSKVHELGGLTPKESWELFQKKLPRGEDLSPDLLKIAQGIVVQCKRLPLSIVIVAGLLSDVERSEKKWNEIAENVTSSVFTDPQGKCKAMLELSYNHLTDHLKSCFLYLGVFPEDYEISFYRLKTLWIAEGFVLDNESNNMEEVAEKYLDDLIGRSLITRASERLEGGVKTCRLHDLLRDFCLDKAKEENFLSVFTGGYNSPPSRKHFLSVFTRGYNSRSLREHFQSVFTRGYNSPPLRDPCRVIINDKRWDPAELHDYLLKISDQSVGSIINFGRLCLSHSILAKKLKVLDTDNVVTGPISHLSSLTHLRFLAIWNISFQGSSVMLSEITKLRNLQTLILDFRYEYEVTLPDSIWDLVNLRHVCIKPYLLFDIDTKRLDNSVFLLENLRTLSKAHLTYSDSEWLRKLPRLQELSCYFSPSWDASLIEYGFPMLHDNNQLLSLKVENESPFITVRYDSYKLHFPKSLTKLTLSKFTSDSGYIQMSDLGRSLPHLEVLKLYHCALRYASSCEWIVNEEDFPKLKVLKLYEMLIYKWIVASEDYFPCLEQLWIERCKDFEEIPVVFGYTASLCSIVVRDCPTSVDESARKIEEMQHEAQNTEFKSHIIPKKR